MEFESGLLKKINCIEFTDNELVSKSIEETDYFACLYNRYEKKLLLYIQRISNLSDNQALDILQESFIKVWKNLHDFEPNLSFNSWIYRIVHHQTVSCWRKSVSFGKNKTVEFTTQDGELWNVEHQDKGQMQEEKVVQLLHLLPEKYSNVLILKYFEDKNYEEISDILKIPEGTVATNLNRAKKAFSELASQHNISFFD